ncbi:MAG TPA: PC4/YdbC family ssDNA-binding protein [Clostridia bacterium]|jgi:hypothetical protein|nr:hypothetical protein [Clostridiaceae bacterium]HOA32446.1 PC4/YdbC family ssDNA-binding protein [Clostridia bacterium]HPZ51672.1 PC4/YdbC family ssDNA-binding protein [Clostridia bacterium]
MAEIRYKIIKRLGVINSSNNGWAKEVNIVSWNDGAAKLDIRDWEQSSNKMRKGITLFRDEAEKLREILNSMDMDDLEQRYSKDEFALLDEYVDVR